MPISASGFTSVIVPSLLSVAMLGTKTPQFSRGLASGYASYLQTLIIQTTDAGTAGTGKGAPLPLVLPSPIWLANLTVGFSKNGLLGVVAPLFIIGLANGLSLASLQVLTNTTHPGVGLGAGVPSIQVRPAFPNIKRGFTEAGLKGEQNTKLARAIASAIETTLRTFIIPIPIIGPPSPSGASGRGTGNFL